MSPPPLYSLVLDVLAETMMFFSAPQLLDRVLAHLCKSPPPLFLMSPMFDESLWSLGLWRVAWMLPLGAGIA